MTKGLFSDRWKTLESMHKLYEEHLLSEAEYRDRPLPVHFHHRLMRISIPVPLAAGLSGANG